MSYLTFIALYLTVGVGLTIWALHDWEDKKFKTHPLAILLSLCIIVVMAPPMFLFFIVGSLLDADTEDGRPIR